MKKIYTVCLFFVLISVNSQTINYNNLWEKLLANKRIESLSYISKLENENPNTIDGLLTRQIVKVENGFLKSDLSFVNEFKKFNDFEYYLYALWNEDFLFKDYINSGFNLETSEILRALEETNIKDETIKSSLTYLSAINSRSNNDFKSYNEKLSKISAIKSWQFCGVFENLNNSGLDISYGPEKFPVYKKGFDTNSNGVINWYNPKIIDSNPYQMFSNHQEFGAGVHYGQTFIVSKETKRVVLLISSSSAFKLWLNDVLLIEESTNVNRDLDAFQVEVTIPKGVNRLLIKNAENDGLSYYSVRVSDIDGNVINSLDYKSTYEKYNKSFKHDLDPKLKTNTIEQYFLNKVKEEPKNILNVYCLAKTYLRNGKYREAKVSISELLKKYPKSSLLRKVLISCYTYERDITSLNNLKKNMQHDDENYYMSLLYKFIDQEQLSRLDLKSLKSFLDKFSKSTDYKILKQTSDLLYNSRISNTNEIKNILDDIMVTSFGWLKMKKTFAPMYETALKDEKKALNIYKELNEKYFDMSVKSYLVEKYNKVNDEKNATGIYKKLYGNINNDNVVIKVLANQLIRNKKYKEAIKYIDKGLEQFPYSFVLLETKGDVLLQLDNKKEAIKYFKQSLHHNKRNSKLRKKIQDLLGENDLVEQLHLKDIYKYIDINRNKIKQNNNYGYNILLDDVIVLLHEEGGGKARYSLVYEITSESGVESFKEYNLGLSGSYKIIKSEIVKSTKEIIPADRKGSNLVFQSLSIGDVVNIDYEIEFIGSGRFYKDYIDYYQFDAYTPCLQTSYTILVPDNINLNYRVENGKIKLIKHRIGKYTKYKWSLENEKPMALQEKYMPNNCDVAKYLHISTISSWNKIANWYSDLVRYQKIFNTEVEKEFSKIFPKGYKQLSEEERAKRIYYYIMDNFTYSHVSFRQSGFTPQKPSKTILTKLGDCKDFSILYNTLAERAGLKSNLVLILTNNHGQKSIILPSQDFNHCIIRVKINGEYQFLELTDKYLSYKSLPTSLINATALLIPNKIEGGDDFKLFNLGNPKKTNSYFEKKAIIKVDDQSQEMDINTKALGSIGSYYFSVFDNSNYNVIKKSIKDDLKEILKQDFQLDTLYNINAKRNLDTLSYSVKLKNKNNVKKIGALSVFQLPILATIYENSIISYNKREYPIEYTQYETTETYKSIYDLYIEEGKKFVEIPESKNFKFKGHNYSINYKLIKNNYLKVIIEAKINIGSNILQNEYKEFKSYVESIISANESFIGYK